MYLLSEKSGVGINSQICEKVNAMRLERIFPHVTTPFDDSGCIEHYYLSENIEKWNETKISGYLILDSNGESIFLNVRLRIRLWCSGFLLNF